MEYRVSTEMFTAETRPLLNTFCAIEAQKNKIENWSNTAFGRARHKDSININAILVLKSNKRQIVHCSKN